MPLIHIDESVDVSLTWPIEVSRARVWQCLTDADLLSQWLGELVSSAVGAGSDFEVDHGDGYCCRVDRRGLRRAKQARLQLALSR